MEIGIKYQSHKPREVPLLFKMLINTVRDLVNQVYVVPKYWLEPDPLISRSTDEITGKIVSLLILEVLIWIFLIEYLPHICGVALTHLPQVYSHSK